MVTIDENSTKEALSFKGLSTDTKPTLKWKSQPILNGSTFFEMDTQEIYFYDEGTNSWLAQP